MRVSLLVVAAALLALTANAGLLFERTVVPAGWVMQGASPIGALVNFTIGLKTQNSAELEALFWAVSDPTSPQYLQYPSAAELEERFGAAAEDRSAVEAWLKAGGNMRLKHVASSISVMTTARVAAKLFKTEIRQFRNNATGAVTHKAWGAYSLPDAIHARVELVTGLSSFPVKRDSPYKAAAAAAPPTVAEAVIPQTVAHMYNIRAQRPQSDKKASQGVVEYEGQYFSNNDTARFAKDVGYTSGNLTIAPIPASRVVGKNDPRNPGVESTLDVQWMAAVNLEAEMWFWIEDGTGWLYEFGNHILNYTNPPQVLSTSYGWWEGDQCSIDGTECQTLGVDSYGYVAAVNKLFQKIGMRGVSLLVASGDSGANGRTDPFCQDATLRAAYPASSPFVTTVGATQIVNGSYAVPNAPAICSKQFSCVWNGTEQAVSLDYSSFTSGGGFSNSSDSARPAYQEAAVSAYLSSGVELPPASYYNGAGRGEPDVAAVGHNGYIVVGGEANLVGGTSMASPIFAAVVALLNEVAIAKAGKPLGFLNPFLYKMAADAPSTFNDITVGDNICTEYGCQKTCKGFYAAPGWDPVTGLGTPNAGNMEAYVSNMMDELLARRATAKAQ